MNIQRDINFFKIADRFQQILCDKGVRLNSDGFPDLRPFRYLKDLPEDVEMWPYRQRNQASNPQKTIITFYGDDGSMYGNLNNIDKVICNLSLYFGVTGFDISPCINFSLARQRTAILINMLTNGLFLTHGLNLIPSLRTGSVETVNTLRCYPRNICYAYGSLGCNQRFLNMAGVITELKLALCEPTQILAYGKLSAIDKAIFDRWNVPYLNMDDYQMRTRRRTMERRNGDA